MKNTAYLLVEQDVLPEVFTKVIQAKQYLLDGEASSTSEAVRMAGISRSVFYKYKDAVYPYNRKLSNHMITVQAMLLDRPGVLMSLVSAVYAKGANNLTINPHIPVNGRALISISARVDHLDSSVEELLEQLRQVEGVLSIDSISDE